MTEREESEPGPDAGVYGISIAAQLSGLDPQSLRLYEKRGLLEPTRTPGGTRLYSADDIARLRRISELLAAGLNLSGIALVLGLQDDNQALTQSNDTLRDQNEQLSEHRRNTRPADRRPGSRRKD